jgi:hypothetical protein
MNRYTVRFDWDDDASVWLATSDDVAGLVLESGSADALVEKVRVALPELLALNGQPAEPMTVRIVSNRDLVMA